MGVLSVATQTPGFKKKNQRKKNLAIPKVDRSVGGWTLDDMGHRRVHTKIRAPLHDSQTEFKASDQSTERSVDLARRGKRKPLESTVSFLNECARNVCVKSGQVQVFFPILSSQ